MPNRWTEFVKEWASKNGKSYKEAMTNLNCKKEYKEKYNKKSESVGGLLNPFINPIKKAKRAFKFTKAIIKGRNDYSPKVRELLKKYGNMKIIKISVCRAPVSKLTTSAINLVSLGEFQKKFENQPYDRLFHLDIRLHLSDLNVLLLEKVETINAQLNAPYRKDVECNEVQLNNELNLTPIQMLENAKKIQGDKFFKYSAYDNNCQDFIMALLKGSNIGNQENYDFVKQDTKVLFENLSGTRKIANTITDLAGSFNVITQGLGIAASVPKKQIKSVLVKIANSDANNIIENDIIEEVRNIHDTYKGRPIPPNIIKRIDYLVNKWNELQIITNILQNTSSIEPKNNKEQELINKILSAGEELMNIYKNINQINQIEDYVIQINNLNEELKSVQETTNMMSEDKPTQGLGIQKSDNYYIQSVVFEKNKFSLKDAKKWIKENNYVSKKPDITDTQIRFRQVNPKYIEEKGFKNFRTKKIGKNSGISLIIAYNKNTKIMKKML